MGTFFETRCRWNLIGPVNGYASACCDLDLWPFDLINVSQPIYNCDQNWVKFVSFWDMVFTRLLEHCLMWPWPLTYWYQKLISTSMNPNTSVTKIGWNSFNNFWDMVFTRLLGRTDSRTHSRTDRPKYRMHLAPFFNGGGDINPLKTN